MVYLAFFLIAICTFLIMFPIFGNSFIVANSFLKKKSAEEIFFLPINIVLLLEFIAIKYFTANFQDNLFPISYTFLVIVFSCALLIGLCGIFKTTKNLSIIFLALSCSTGAFLLPDNFLLVGITLSSWQQKLCIALWWFIFVIGLRQLNKVYGLFPTYGLMLLISFFAFFLSSGIATVYFLFSAGIIGILLTYLLLNWYPAQINFSEATCYSLGFLIGFVLLCGSGEFMWLPIQILQTFLWTTIIITFYDKFYNHHKQKKIAPQTLCIECFEIMFLINFLAIIQVHIAQSMALIIFAVLLILWVKHRLGFDENAPATLREIGIDLKQVFKKNFKNIQDKK